ncbi:alkaline phosphatase [Iamia sp. SCSIO 61187]|uniref:alkaline phosphatase D family protein n=1 Tax=Iamia sp. SCSIO 61187 TaxID=2722752 RepID=UPI001C62C98E|nr:alkaline phosphatase D family protein [Iamia sp. SCSIO 61187]
MTPNPLTRRRFLTLSAAGAAAVASARLDPAGAVTRAGAPGAAGGAVRDPFTLGVASGDPTPGGIVLWTRLAPRPLEGGGMPNRRVPVQWEVATDERFSRVVARGAEHATPAMGHSVHAEVSGLRPGHWYWYRFRAGRTISPVGRTRTAPAQGAHVASTAFALTSCQSYTAGYFTAHRHMSEEDLDLVVQVGDYIYEGAPNPANLRVHEGVGEPVTLIEYRNRHAQYRADADLQAAHAAFPWAVVLDDHEIDNNWADEVPQDPARQPRDAFLARRAAALQAYYEHMPLRRSSLPQGIDAQLYRRLTFGDLLDVHVLDTRQYRSDQDRARRLDPSRTILGDEQERWLMAGLAGPTARWNALAQQVFFSQRDFTAGPDATFSDDAWDDYVPERNALRDHIAAVGASNPVILTGDVHASYVCDVKADFDDPASATVATELVGTSISTGGDGVEQGSGDPVQLAENPHIRFINRRRGYLRNVVTHTEWTADFRTVDVVTVPGAPVATKASFVIEDGRAGAVAV